VDCTTFSRPSFCPHSPQNFLPTGILLSQRGHTMAISVPHDSQNLTPSRLLDWHVKHFIYRRSGSAIDSGFVSPCSLGNGNDRYREKKASIKSTSTAMTGSLKQPNKGKNDTQFYLVIDLFAESTA
jgi:hypothetical protein